VVASAGMSWSTVKEHTSSFSGVVRACVLAILTLRCTYAVLMIRLTLVKNVIGTV
jgi:hypothetical protein